jgi:hypothetical protein
MLKRVLLVAAFAGTFSAVQAGQPAISFFPGSGTSSVDTEGPWNGPEMTIYDSEYCDSDNAGECALVSLSCDDQYGRGLRISIDGLELEELIQWMMAEAQTALGMHLTVSGLKPEGQPHFGEITVNEMDGTWSAAFYAAYSSDPGLTIDGDVLNFDSMLRTVTIELSAERTATLEEFIQSCASE